MPSPFPGMNPYLEQSDVWQDFHQSYVPRLREALVPQLRPRYRVTLEEFLFIHEAPAGTGRRAGRSDASIGMRGPRAPQAGTGLLNSPARVSLTDAFDVERHAYVQVKDGESGQIVTVIELLSPSNKRPGGDRDNYVKKRMEVLRSSASLVELDLLRGHPRLPMDQPPSTAYCIVASRPQDRPEANIWPIGLREALPVLPIPLLGSEEPARLDLQALLHATYDAAGYGDYIYGHEPEPPLSAEDYAWARGLIGQDKAV